MFTRNKQAAQVQTQTTEEQKKQYLEGIAIAIESAQYLLAAAKADEDAANSLIGFAETGLVAHRWFIEAMPNMPGISEHVTREQITKYQLGFDYLESYIKATTKAQLLKARCAQAEQSAVLNQLQQIKQQAESQVITPDSIFSIR